MDSFCSLIIIHPNLYFFQIVTTLIFSPYLPAFNNTRLEVPADYERNFISTLLELTSNYTYLEEE